MKIGFEIEVGFPCARRLARFAGDSSSPRSCRNAGDSTQSRPVANRITQTLTEPERLAEHALSAQEICRTIITAEVRSRCKNPLDEDWVWLALTVLWERWFPERPNFEQLDEAMQAGYAHSETA